MRRAADPDFLIVAIPPRMIIRPTDGRVASVVIDQARWIGIRLPGMKMMRGPYRTQTPDRATQISVVTCKSTCHRRARGIERCRRSPHPSTRYRHQPQTTKAHRGFAEVSSVRKHGIRRSQAGARSRAVTMASGASSESTQTRQIIAKQTEAANVPIIRGGRNSRLEQNLDRFDHAMSPKSP